MLLDDGRRKRARKDSALKHPASRRRVELNAACWMAAAVNASVFTAHCRAAESGVDECKSSEMRVVTGGEQQGE